MENAQQQQTFDQWLTRLNKTARWSGYRTADLVASTGAETWLHFYEQGLSPADALEEAERDGLEFGGEYCEI